jgi:Zn-dependent membrane protease YugP
MNSFAFLVLVGVPLLLGLYAQARVSSAFSRYKSAPASSGLTGAQAARKILELAKIPDVEVSEINGMLGDHYDPIRKRLCLSSAVYHAPSLAALGIAAHEAGHAIQHARAYRPLRLRMGLVPVTQISSQMLPFIILGGLAFQIPGLIMVGVACYAILTLFQLVTLPVEFDASNRAKTILQQTGMIQGGGEESAVREVLNAAALTYVAAFVAALGNLLYLLKLRGEE